LLYILLDISKALVGLVAKYSERSVAVMTTQDDNGLSFLKSIQKEALSKSVSVSFTTTYRQLGDNKSIEEALKAIIKNGEKVIILQMLGIASVVMKIAHKLGMLNGNYWIIGSTGFDERLLAFNVLPEEARAFKGLWQVATRLPFRESNVDFRDTTETAREFRLWHRKLYNLDATDSLKRGVATGYDYRMVSLQNLPILQHVPNNCKNGSNVEQIATNMTNMKFPFILGNNFVNITVQGDVCIGDNGDYLGGYLVRNTVGLVSDFLLIQSCRRHTMLFLILTHYILIPG
jgi:hypothetical protein